MRKTVIAANTVAVGFSKVEITPAGSLPMGGYIARQEPAAGKHDPLFAKAVFFGNGEKGALLLSLDLLHLSGEWRRTTKQEISEELGIPAERILLAATHTHSGPAVFSPLLGNEAIAAYEEILRDSCLQAAKQAATSAEESRLSACSADTVGIVRNRRSLIEHTNDLLSVVKVETPSGKIRGHVVSFSCHPTVMAADNLEYSADLFGAAALHVERMCPGAFCILFNGAAGDLSTRFTRKEQSWNELDRLGQKLARKIAQSHGSFPLKALPITGLTAHMSLPLRPVPPVKKAQRMLGFAKMRLMGISAFHPYDKKTIRLLEAKVEGAAAQLLISRLGGWQRLFGAAEADLELQVIRVGDIVFCGLPGEFFGKRGLELSRAARPKFGFVIGYANGYWGYIVPPKEAQKGGYEAMMSPLHPKDEPKIIRCMKTLMKEATKRSERRQNA